VGARSADPSPDWVDDRAVVPPGVGEIIRPAGSEAVEPPGYHLYPVDTSVSIGNKAYMPRRNQARRPTRKRKPRKPTARTFNTRRARLLAHRGHGPTEIARRIDAHPETVRRFLIKVGLHEVRPDKWKLTDDQLLAELRRGLDGREAARRHGASEINAYSRVCRVMREREIREINSARLRQLRRHPAKVVTADHTTCLVCGARTRALVSHLVGHRLSLRGYMRRYGLKRAELPVRIYNRPGQLEAAREKLKRSPKGKRKAVPPAFDRAKARALARQGLSFGEIASRVGCHRETVRQYLVSVGLHQVRPVGGGLTDEELLSELEAGLSPNDIIEKWGIKKPKRLQARINEMMRRRGLTEIDSPILRRLRRRPTRSIRDDHVICLICGLRTSALETHLRGHRVTVRGYTRRYGFGEEDVPARQGFGIRRPRE